MNQWDIFEPRIWSAVGRLFNMGWINIGRIRWRIANTRLGQPKVAAADRIKSQVLAEPNLQVAAVLFSENLFSIDYRIQGHSLFCRRRDSEERIVPWGPDAGARCQTTGKKWTSHCPSIDINFMEQLSASALSPQLLPRQRNRIVASRFLLNAWPLHVRELVRRFPTGHWQLLMFLNDGGDTAFELLESNPALGFLAAQGAFAGRDGGNAGVQALLSQKRRHLAAQFGFAATEASVRVLKKIQPESVSQPLLDDVKKALTDQQCERSLAYLSRITPVLLRVVTHPGLLGRFTPACIRQLERIRAGVPHSDIIARLENLAAEARVRNVVVPIIHSLKDIDTAFRPPPPLPRRKSLPAPKGRFPDPPVSETETIKAIRSRRDLRRESDEMRHCIGTNRYYTREILRGNLYAYRVLKPERLTLAVSKVAGEWQIGEVKGFQNALPASSTVQMIESWLRGKQSPSSQSKTCGTS